MESAGGSFGRLARRHEGAAGRRARGGAVRWAVCLSSVCLLAALASVAAASPAAASSPALPSMSASSAIIIDRVSGTVLWGKGKHRRRPMASCTKIMTALLVVERCRDLTASSARRSG
jgi:D-alanyl-D-alanine carboxypeptidase